MIQVLNKLALAILLSISMTVVSEAAPKKSRAKAAQTSCAILTVTLPVKAEQIIYGVSLDIDGLTPKGGKSMLRIPEPSAVAACNSFVKARPDEVAAKNRAYDPERFYFAVVEGRYSFVGLNVRRSGVVLRTPAEMGQDGSAVVHFKLPMGQPIFVGFSVCDSRDWSWRFYTTRWNGKRHAKITFGPAVQSQSNAYRTGGPCERYNEWRSSAGRESPRATSLRANNT